jgi:DNA-binding FadR family transcriptional regulator
MTVSTPGRDRSGMAEMRRIVDAISARDPEEAYTASNEHVRSAARLALSYLTPEK